MKKVGNILQIGALAILFGSFFIKDKKKAKNTRWLAAGTFVAGYGIQLYTNKKGNA